MAAVSDEDVDFIFTWVDGSDPNHRAARQKFLKNIRNVHPSSHETCRWRVSGEIEESIKSVIKFAPWARHIYVICSMGQMPPLLSIEDQSKIKIVQDSELRIPALPVFNSHAIEANIHKIPGLAEKMIYMCDDMFLGQFLPKSLFFDETTGQAKIFAFGAILGSNTYQPTARLPAWQTARINNGNLLNKVFGKKAREDTIHQARPLTKRAIETAWNQPAIKIKLLQTSRSQFRAPSDVEPIGLFSWVGIETNSCVVSRLRIRNKYLQISDYCNFGMHAKELKVSAPQLYCLNDTMIRPSEAHLKNFKRFLVSHLPHSAAPSK